MYEECDAMDEEPYIGGGGGGGDEEFYGGGCEEECDNPFGAHYYAAK